MRIYDGSPRQDWEEVLRSVGAFADQERIKELLLLELEGGFLLQGLGMRDSGGDSDSFGSLAKRTYELTEDQVAEMMDASAAKRGSADRDRADELLRARAAPHRRLHRPREGARRVPLRAGRVVRAAPARWFRHAGRGTPAVRVHPGRDLGYDRGRT
jgi:hypothetical protein